MTYISEHTRELRRTMPTFDGVIVDPRWVPQHRKAEYLAQWGEWLRKHPKSEWEPWMHDLVAHMKHKKGKRNAAD